MATYSITITSEEDLAEQWLDSNVPHISFGYNEIELQECVDNGDGTYTATYESMVLPSDRTYTYIHPVNGETTYTVSAGEYGVKP
jgi:hypothetical protein|tara:strand:+ start:571 stop:825 length:255 start_codon:yes stop_codon:yes gene_type:complete